MGGAVSTGLDNDDLIDNLLGADYIRTPEVEKVFRVVDRADYFLPEAKHDAYKDLAWKSGNLHLSAPCIYSEVMEGLCLKPGLSFLNLGSGTGYLSTMVGLLIGSNGINHGVEIYEDVIKYANKKLEEFKSSSEALDEYDFCEPKFIQGNCLCLSSEMRQYDRIYCGAACPKRHENYMKNLIKIGGILVMPVNDQLLQIKRVSETSWDITSLLSVSFATLIAPSDDKTGTVDIIPVEPRKLQEVCRAEIRNHLRRLIELENPQLKVIPLSKPKTGPKKKRALRSLVVPFFDSSDENSDEDLFPPVAGNRDLGRVGLMESRYDEDRQQINIREVNTLMNFVLGRRAARDEERRQNGEEERRENDRDRESDDEQIENDRQSNNEDGDDDIGDKKCEPDKMETEKCENDNMEAESNYQPKNLNLESSNENDSDSDRPRTSPKRKRSETEGENNTEQESDEENEDGRNSFRAIDEIHNVIIGVLQGIQRERGAINSDENEDDEDTENRPSGSSAEKPTKSDAKREKFDSGLGEEMVDDKSSDSSDTSDSEDDFDLRLSSDGDEDNGRPKKRSFPLTYVKSGGKWRKIDSVNNSDDEQEKDNKENKKQRVKVNPYTPLMRSKIQDLPLPQILKNYLNFFREF